MGFVNHCRILHKLKFPTYEDAARHCGIPVVSFVDPIEQKDESEVPKDDPSRKERTFESKRKSRKILDSVDDSMNDDEPVGPVPLSRFYVRKRIVIGNTSKHLKRLNGNLPKITFDL